MRMHLPVGWAVKPTLYRQFVCGETLEQCTRIVNHLKQFNVKSVLDFSVEGGASHSSVQRAYAEISRPIDYAANNLEIPYTVFKPTAMMSSEVLEKADKNEMNAFRERVLSLCRKAYEKR